MVMVVRKDVSLLCDITIRICQYNVRVKWLYVGLVLVVFSLWEMQQRCAFCVDQHFKCKLNIFVHLILLLFSIIVHVGVYLYFFEGICQYTVPTILL